MPDEFDYTFDAWEVETLQSILIARMKDEAEMIAKLDRSELPEGAEFFASGSMTAVAKMLNLLTKLQAPLPDEARIPYCP